MYVIDIIKYTIYFLLLIVCAITDYKKGKIYNKYLIRFLIFYILLYGIEYLSYIMFNIIDVNLINDKLKNEFFGFIIGFVIGFVFYILGIFKGGDGKLLAIVGMCAGYKQIFIHFSIIIIIAGIGSLYVLLKNKVLIDRLHRVYLYLKGLILTMKYNRYVSEPNDKIKFPFAVYILIGEVISYLNYFFKEII